MELLTVGLVCSDKGHVDLAYPLLHCNLHGICSSHIKGSLLMFLFVSTVSTISDLYTVKQLKTQMSAKPEYTTSMGFTGFMFAVVTTLDINAGDFKRIVGSKW